MRAMILAAGRGSRLSPLTDTVPKPLVQVDGKALIEYQIEALCSAGINEIVINTGWLGQKLIKHLGNGSRYQVAIEYTVEPQEGLETGGGILQALPLLGKQPFLIVNADVYHQIDLRDLLQHSQQIPHKQLVHLLLINNPHEHPNGDFCLQGNLLKEKDDCSSDTTNVASYTYSGMGIYHPDLFQDAKPGKFSVVPLIKKAIRQNMAYGLYVNAPWFDAGTQERLKKIEEFILVH